MRYSKIALPFYLSILYLILLISLFLSVSCILYNYVFLTILSEYQRYSSFMNCTWTLYLIVSEVYDIPSAGSCILSKLIWEIIVCIDIRIKFLPISSIPFLFSSLFYKQGAPVYPSVLCNSSFFRLNRPVSPQLTSRCTANPGESWGKESTDAACCKPLSKNKIYFPQSMSPDFSPSASAGGQAGRWMPR